MTDIVARLRSRSPYLKDSAAERDMEEAADEIERQQAEIEHLRTTIGYLADNISDYPALIAVAEAALKPKP